MLLPKKLLLLARTSENYETSWAYAPGYYLTFISFALFDLSNRGFSKKSIFTCCSVLSDFCHYLHVASISFLFEFFWKKELWKEVATVAMLLWMSFTCVETEPKWSFILITLMLLMRIVWSFVWRKFSSVGREEWCDEMKNGQKLKLGDAHVTPKIYSRSTSVKAWGCPRHPLLHQQKYQVLFQYTIFLLLHMLCVVLGASLFLFLV